ncbi:MAG: hypothetical protein NZO58_04250 [Gemmataceae bacterium]|nr:hypothetical protein [Gemmataceae bacterium]
MFHRFAASAADWLWFLLCAAGSSAWCLTAATHLGATFDETLYLRAGLEAWRTGSHEPLLRMGTMPLPVNTATLPLYLRERWIGVDCDLDSADFDRCLRWARATNLVFWWLLLACAQLVGRDLGGSWGGRLAVALLACEPNFLAHATLATTDIAAAATVLLAAYWYARVQSCPDWGRRIGLPAFGYGLALFAKASALVYVPACWLAVAWQRRSIAEHNESGACRRFFADGWRIAGLGMVVVFILCGCDWRPHPSLVRWAAQLPAGAFKDAMTWLADHLTVFSNAGQGIVYQIGHNLRGHGAFLLGTAASRGMWGYFPVLLLIKLPAALLMLLSVLAIVRRRSLANWACAAAGGLLLFSLTCRVQIGIRLMLPWLALGIVGLAAAWVNAVAAMPAGWRRRSLLGTGAGGVAWMFTAALAIWPHGLTYVNELWGGPEQGYLLVSDSNYDWGQGLPELAAWQRRHGIERLDLCYFGTDPNLRRLPMRPLSAATMAASEFLQIVRGRYVAVGTTWLYGAYVPYDAEVPRLLRTLKPVARTRTFLIFDFSDAAQGRGAGLPSPVAQCYSSRRTIKSPASTWVPGRTSTSAIRAGRSA